MLGGAYNIVFDNLMQFKGKSYRWYIDNRMFGQRLASHFSPLIWVLILIFVGTF